MFFAMTDMLPREQIEPLITDVWRLVPTLVDNAVAAERLEWALSDFFAQRFKRFLADGGAVPAGLPPVVGDYSWIDHPHRQWVFGLEPLPRHGQEPSGQHRALVWAARLAVLAQWAGEPVGPVLTIVEAAAQTAAATTEPDRYMYWSEREAAKQADWAARFGTSPWRGNRRLVYPHGARANELAAGDVAAATDSARRHNAALIRIEA